MRKDVRNEIIRIGGDNINKSEMARIMGCSRQTIYNREERLKNPKPKKEVIRTSKLDPFKEIIDTKVDKYRSKGMNVYKFIQKQGYTGGYGIVRNYIKKHKNEQIKKATIRFETIPGLQAQVDWKESMKLVNKKGEMFEINIFLMILGYSRYKYIELTSDKTQNTLFRCMVGAFEYFNGCPREILFDNMRTVVDKARTTTTEVVFNKRFKEFSNDAGFTPLACVGYRPKTKGKIETLARIMERLRPYNEEFETWDELDKIVKDIMEDINNEVVQGVNIIPSKIHEKEKEYLNSLPLWDRLLNYYMPEKTYKVSKESMITYKGKKYSVPTYLIGKQVTISEIDSRINIYYNITDFVCQHEISDRFLNYHESDLKEIMKSEAYRNKTDQEIQEIIELKKKDELLGVKIYE